MLARKLNVNQCLLEFPVFLTLTVFNRITLFSLNVTQLYAAPSNMDAHMVHGNAHDDRF